MNKFPRIINEFPNTFQFSTDSAGIRRNLGILMESDGIDRNSAIPADSVGFRLEFPESTGICINLHRFTIKGITLASGITHKGLTSILKFFYYKFTN